MPDDSNGIYNVPNGTLVNSGDTVLPSQHNPWANDSATAISNRFSKDGRAPATGNWNLNSFRITNLATPIAHTDAVTKQYVDSSNSVYALVSGNTTVGLTDKGKWYRTVTSGIVFTPSSAATLGANYFFSVKNDSSGIVTIDPTGSETINGTLTVSLNPGSEAYVICDGANFWASIVSQQASGPDYVQGLSPSNNSGDPNNDIDLSSGTLKVGQKVVTNSGTFTKRLDAAWAAGSGNGGLDTGSKANSSWYYEWALRNTTTGAFDAIFSLSATSGGVTVPSGYEIFAPLSLYVVAFGTDASGNIRAFRYINDGGDEMYWYVSRVKETVPGISTSASLVPLTVTPSSTAVINIGVTSPTPAFLLATSSFETDTAPDSTLYTLGHTASEYDASEIRIASDSSRQIRLRASGAGQTVVVNTRGYQVPSAR